MTSSSSVGYVWLGMGSGVNCQASCPTWLDASSQPGQISSSEKWHLLMKLAPTL